MTTESFENLQLGEPIQRALKKAGYKIPTPIQAQSIPHLLQGKDLIGVAQTGTGKTAAFVLPLLEHLSNHAKVTGRGAPHALILTPTRELAAQIGKSIRKYGRYLRIVYTTIYGGVKQRPQVSALENGIDILVATPGRLLDLMNQGHVTLEHIDYLVLDEADRMLDMGFIKDVNRIIKSVPRTRQSLFFSATMSKNVEALARHILKNPIHIEVTPPASTVKITKQRVLFVDQQDKDSLLLKLLEENHFQKVLVFTRTKHRADRVVRKLAKKNISAIAIHSNKSQGQRTRALQSFKAGHVRVLVATDIAARGIDVTGISHVINYDIPREAESYVHRIGRTARAGAKGTAFSFCSAEERSYLCAIERTTGVRLDVRDHPYHSADAQAATGPAARPPPKEHARRKGSRRAAGRSSFRRSQKRRGRNRRR